MNHLMKTLALAAACAVVAFGYIPTLIASGPRTAHAQGAQGPDPNPAINFPDKFAWTIFVELNKAANNGKKDRVWETWASDEDVFGNPNRTPVWPGSGTGLAAGPPQTKRLRPITQLQIAIEEDLRRPRQRRRRPRRPGAPGGLFLPPQGSGEEVRMNRATFDHIVEKELWYVEGQEAAFSQGKKIDFPIDAKEIKAVWQPITEAQKARFYWQINPADNRPYGLVALHIITKDVPNWTWATFEQVDNPGRCRESKCKDDFGLTPDGNPSPELLRMLEAANLGPEWQFYRLDGAQVDFADSEGKVTLLGNSVIEQGFEATSSCITCHARATIGARIPGQARANRLSVFKSTNPLVSDNGTPDPRWFYSDPSNPTTRKYLQLDFLWSMFRAKRRTR